MDRHHADRRAALLLERAGEPGRRAFSDALGTRLRRARQPGLYPPNLGFLAPYPAAHLGRQLGRARSRRNRPGYGQPVGLDRDRARPRDRRAQRHHPRTHLHAGHRAQPLQPGAALHPCRPGRRNQVGDGDLQPHRHHLGLRGARHRAGADPGLAGGARGGPGDGARQPRLQPVLGTRARHRLQACAALLVGLARRARARRRLAGRERALYRVRLRCGRAPARPGLALYRLVGVQLRLRRAAREDGRLSRRGGPERYPHLRDMVGFPAAVRGSRQAGADRGEALGARPHRHAEPGRDPPRRRSRPGAHHPHQPLHPQAVAHHPGRSRPRARERHRADQEPA